MGALDLWSGSRGMEALRGKSRIDLKSMIDIISFFYYYNALQSERYLACS